MHAARPEAIRNLKDGRHPHGRQIHLDIPLAPVLAFEAELLTASAPFDDLHAFAHPATTLVFGIPKPSNSTAR